MRHMQGHAQALLQLVQVKLVADMTPDPQRPEYHRAMLQWETYVRVLEPQLNESLLFRVYSLVYSSLCITMHCSPLLLTQYVQTGPYLLPSWLVMQHTGVCG